MMYEEDDDDNDDSDMDDDMMISPHLSSKESAPSRRVGFVESGLGSPDPWFMSVWLYSHNRRTRGERGARHINIPVPCG